MQVSTVVQQSASLAKEEDDDNNKNQDWLVESFPIRISAYAFEPPLAMAGQY